jgi:Spy/CpxP family protein refolding chaperone
MSNVKLFLVLAFVMVCAAGAGVGMIVDQRLRPVIPVAEPHHDRGGPMEQLKLTPDQRDKMRIIWSEVGKLRDQRFRDRRELSQKRDSQILALLTADQKAAYDKIQESYRTSVKEDEDSLQKAVQIAEDQTRAILTPEQQAHYEEIRKNFGVPGDRRRGGGRNREHNHSTTQPATMPAQMTLSMDSSR